MHDHNQHDHDPIVQITTDATKEAMLAQRAHQMEAQAKRVDDLRDQINHRLSDLRHRLRLAEDAVGHAGSSLSVNLHYGMFGHDTETIDEMLRALAQEAEALCNMRAAEESTARLTEKYEAIIATHAPAPPRESVSVGGQYL